MQAVNADDHDAVAGGKTRLDDGMVALGAGDLDDAPRHLGAVVRQHPDVPPAVGVDDRGRGDEDFRRDGVVGFDGDGGADAERGDRILEREPHTVQSRDRIGERRDLAHLRLGGDLRRFLKPHIELHAGRDARHEIVRDVDDGVAAVGTGDRHDGLAGVDILADFGRPRGDDAIEIRGQFGVADLLFGEPQRGLRLIEPPFGSVAAGDGIIERRLGGAAFAGQNALPACDAFGVGDTELRHRRRPPWRGSSPAAR